MISFILITLCEIGLVFGTLGAGAYRSSSLSSASLRGWSIFLGICATSWFFKFPAQYLALPLTAFLIIGNIHFFKKIPNQQKLLALLCCIITGGIFSFPFLRYPGLLAYAHWGTDQWGYTGVSRWLIHHSVDQLPVLDCKIGLDWVWLVLKVQDRPLAYELMAAIASVFHVSTVLTYFILPSALFSSISCTLILSSSFEGFRNSVLRTGFLMIVTLHPLLLIHFHYQFLGGTLSALYFILLLVTIFLSQKEKSADLIFLSVALIFSVFLGGLYTLKLTWFCLLLLGTIYGLQIRPLLKQLNKKKCISFAILGAVFSFYLWKTYSLTFERGGANHGRFGHVFSQGGGGLFGVTDLSAWYNPDADFVIHHFPSGSYLSIALFLTLMIYLTIQSYRWWLQKKDGSMAISFLSILAGLVASAPPLGSHWTLSRSLPIFGVPLFYLCLFSLSLRQKRWVQNIALALILIPGVRAIPGLSKMIISPVNRFVDQADSSPPEKNYWGCSAYAYFYDDTRTIDWTQAPDCFRAMSHYLPADVKPRMNCSSPPRSP